MPVDEYINGATFVDLTKNPERFTGYTGSSAHRIWNSIYKENCFKYVFCWIRVMRKFVFQYHDSTDMGWLYRMRINYEYRGTQ